MLRRITKPAVAAGIDNAGAQAPSLVALRLPVHSLPRLSTGLFQTSLSRAALSTKAVESAWEFERETAWGPHITKFNLANSNTDYWELHMIATGESEEEVPCTLYMTEDGVRKAVLTTDPSAGVAIVDPILAATLKETLKARMPSALAESPGSTGHRASTLFFGEEIERALEGVDKSFKIEV